MTEQEIIKNELLQPYECTVNSLHLINKNALDVTCMTHGSEYEKVGELACILEDKRDRAKYEVDEVYALLTTKYREETEKDGGKPLSDKKIEAMVITSSEYKEILTQYLDLKYKTNLIESLIKSLDKKTKELDNLCSLYLGGYFAHNVGEVKEKTVTTMRNIVTEQRNKI